MYITVQIGDITLGITQKKIKNIHLSVYPPDGTVKISAPDHMSLDTIRAFAIPKLDWIKQQQKKVQNQARETSLEYINSEKHYVWGKPYSLQVIDTYGTPSVKVNKKTLLLHVKPGSDLTKKQAVIESWYRDQIRSSVPKLIEKWEPVMGVKVANFYVRQMKTLWGSCNPKAGNIRLNSELARNNFNRNKSSLPG